MESEIINDLAGGDEGVDMGDLGTHTHSHTDSAPRPVTWRDVDWN
jgi:hypothetical protein